MGLFDVVARVGAGVFALLTVTFLLVVDRRRLRAAPGVVRSNLRAVAPALGVLIAILALNGVVRDAGVDLSWIIGLNVTGHIYALEGRFVAHLQSLGTPALTLYFELVYVVGYAFLLAFPVLAYAVHDEERPLRELLVAYAVNYALGLVCYVTFVAYGPRNFMPELVEPLLYTNWPQAQLLTSQVNANTNVFPSLHASLAATVALLAHRFRAVYPRWLPLATLLAASVVVSTMYLGIHWATDVVAGFALAGFSVTVADRTDRIGFSRRVDDLVEGGRLRKWRR